MRRCFFASADDRCLDELVAAACGSTDSGFRSRKIGDVMARLGGIRADASQLEQATAGRRASTVFDHWIRRHSTRLRPMQGRSGPVGRFGFAFIRSRILHVGRLDEVDHYSGRSPGRAGNPSATAGRRNLEWLRAMVEQWPHKLLSPHLNPM